MIDLIANIIVFYLMMMVPCSLAMFDKFSGPNWKEVVLSPLIVFPLAFLVILISVMPKKADRWASQFVDICDHITRGEG